MKTVTLPSGEVVAALGQGTWNMGERAAARAEELASLRLGLDLGMTLIDTAEMYGEGRAEELVGEAIAGRRDEAFIVSKVYPHNASRHGTLAACERSLKRLKTDRIDLYLLHWRGETPLAETFDAFGKLQRAGKIVHFGVSNFSIEDMRECLTIETGQALAVNQVLYNLSRRGIEWDLLPWLGQHHMPLMAYSPLEQARLLRNPRLQIFARDRSMTPAQAALAWLLAREQLIAIPKAAHRDRVRENAGAQDHPLTVAQMRELDTLFAPPSAATALEML